MVKNLSILFSVLILVSYFTHINPVYANSISSMYKYDTAYQPPGKTVKDDVIIAFLEPYLYDAFKTKGISANQVNLDTSIITSITPLPNREFKIELYANTSTTQSGGPPYGIYIVTIITDGKSVNITSIERS